MKGVAKFVVCCSRDWRFKGESANILLLFCTLTAYITMNFRLDFYHGIEYYEPCLNQSDRGHIVCNIGYLR